jgi:hypothetical protein
LVERLFESRVSAPKTVPSPSVGVVAGEISDSFGILSFPIRGIAPVVGV